MPTAVITESSEKTMSSSMIWTMTAANDGAARAEPCPSSPSSRSWISIVALPSRNSPPPIRMRSRPEMSWPKTVKSGAVSRMIQAIDSSSSDAHHHRGEQARCAARAACWSCGSLPDRIEMKMTLSTPRITSRNVSVSEREQAFGTEKRIHGASRYHDGLKWPRRKGLSLGQLRTTVAMVLFGLPAVAPQQRTPDIHFAATPHVVVDAMLKLARVTPQDVVYDLGSGDGRIVIIAAQKYGSRGVGIELDRGLIEISRQVAREGDVASRVTFVEGDLFTADISAATVVTLWLSSTVNSRLEPKLKRELRPGTRVVSRQFPIGTWAPAAAFRFEKEDLFLWTIPER